MRSLLYIILTVTQMAWKLVAVVPGPHKVDLLVHTSKSRRL